MVSNKQEKALKFLRDLGFEVGKLYSLEELETKIYKLGESIGASDSYLCQTLTSLTNSNIFVFYVKIVPFPLKFDYKDGVKP